MPMDRRLSQRKEVILRALIEEYVRTGEPVASKFISDRLAAIFGSGYASATVRNELVALEDEGLIYQPHVSAGRMPTDLGYRYFVERLMSESQLSLDEQRLIGHQFYQVQRQLDEWVRLTASVMAQALQSAAIITPPRSAIAQVKHFEVLSLYETVALVVLVMADGSVQQERLALDEPFRQDDLSRLARRLNERFAGADAETLRRRAAQMESELTNDERLIVDSLARMLNQASLSLPEAVYHEGLANLLRRDEFTHGDAERIREVVEALERNSILPAIAPQLMASDGVQVIIGGESGSDALKDISVVAARYGGNGRPGGLLGVVGPTRMQYGRAVAVVRYLTQVLNDLLAETYTESYADDDDAEPASDKRDDT
ncbi:MAG: heat-inducible transcription repressor HrcA [Chloroflexota bacterium]|nr:heat-inducible transcription repressor HrcA [Chloroflexota bacterium]